MLVGAALAAVIATGIGLRIAHLGEVPSRGPDEKFYTYFASRVADEGLGAVRSLFAEYEGKSAMWSYPVPTRISYVLLTAAAMSVTHRRDESCGAAVSCLFSILSLLLLAWIGLRFFNGWIAVAAVAFMALSVGELGTAPRAWVDALFAFLGLALLYVTCEITRDPRSLRWYPAFFAAGTLLLLTKQTGVIAFGLCGLWALWVVGVEKRYGKGALVLAAAALMSVAVTIGIWGMLAGGVGIAFSAFNHSLHPGPAGKAFIEEFSSGPWYRFIYLLWVVGPVTAVLALVGGVVTVSRRQLFPAAGARAAAACVLMTLTHVGFSCFVPGMQNLRYIAPADGAYGLLAGIGLWHSRSLARRRFSPLRYRSLLVAGIATVALGLAHDYRTFLTVVLRSGAEDMPAKGILEWRR